MQIRVPNDNEYRAIRDAVRFIELNRQRILRVIGRRFMPIIGDGSGGGASSTAVRLFKIERRKRLSTNPPRWGYFGREVTYDADDHSLSNVTGGWASDGVILSQADEDTDLATITAPTPGTVLEPNGDDEIDFTWSSAVGATNYKIDFGSTQGGTDYATSTRPAPATASTRRTSLATALWSMCECRATSAALGFTTIIRSTTLTPICTWPATSQS
jgi:hypothetical protein